MSLSPFSLPRLARIRFSAACFALALLAFPRAAFSQAVSSAPSAASSPSPRVPSVPPTQQGGASSAPSPIPATAPPPSSTQTNGAVSAPGGTAAPTQTAANGADAPTVFHANVNEVNLIFTVTDRHGHFIQNLQQKDFALLDNQRAPEEVFSFTQQTNLPLRVGIVIDASTSIRQRFQFEQQAAITFLQEVIRPKTDLAFIMGFDVSSYVTQGYTNDQDKLEAGINKLHPGGGTALYDAVYTACRDQMMNPPFSPHGAVRKALIVISDGDDNQSRAYPDDAIKECERAGTIIYTVSTDVSPSPDRGDDVLRKMSDTTGGTPFFPRRLEDMANSFHSIEDELRSQYSLVYRPADFKPDGSFRSIYLVTLDKRYAVQASRGYFATNF